MRRFFTSLFLLSALVWQPAQAQLPGVALPEIPDIGRAAQQFPAVGDSLSDVQGLRRAQVRDVLRTHRRELETDPAGEPIVRSQIIALDMSQAAIVAARGQGFDVVRSDVIDASTSMVTLRAPAGMSTRRALRRLRAADPDGVYDFDHLHLESGAGLVLGILAQSSAASTGPRIGLIDSGVDASVRVTAQRAFASETPIAAVHGTTIATMLSSAAPGARLYVADIYGAAPTGGASSALARALAWLAQDNVPTINVSLVGPRNRVVEAVVARMIARGFVIVAAVGNDGPAAAPLYPAAYDGVIGVTGVDARQRVLLEAGRGAQVDFAALGVHGSARGTSYAAPIITARVATGMPYAASAQDAIGVLRAQARDLGASGRDDIYGYGLIAAP
jgi:subtilisin family serine protease